MPLQYQPQAMARAVELALGRDAGGDIRGDRTAVHCSRTDTRTFARVAFCILLKK